MVLTHLNDQMFLSLQQTPAENHTLAFMAWKFISASGNEAVIDPNRCSGCGLCSEMCRFGAVSGTQPFRIDTLKCEGCKLCVEICPAKAIDFELNHCGDWYRSTSRFGPMVHAQLFPAEENSGRLVALLRQQARAMAEAKGLGHAVLCAQPVAGAED